MNFFAPFAGKKPPCSTHVAEQPHRRHFLRLGLQMAVLGSIGWLGKALFSDTRHVSDDAANDRFMVINGWVIPEKLLK